MGRGVSAGGGQSSLDYLFGGGPPQTSPSPSKPLDNNNTNDNNNNNIKCSKAGIDTKIPAGITRSTTNNYHRADGQNCGNFITDRPSTKVHAAPGGGSSLGYLFGEKDK